jgi:hypothetical protein
VHKASSIPHTYCEVPLEVLFTAGKISCCLYQFCVTQSIQGSHRGKKTKYLVDVSIIIGIHDLFGTKLAMTI